MPVPGYDPEDLDEALETMLDESDLEALLTDEEWRAYRNGDADLVDCLDEDEIERLLDERDAGDAT